MAHLTRFLPLAVVLTLLVVVTWVWSWLGLLGLLGGAIAIYLVATKLHWWWTLRQFRRKWSGQGKDLLLVYSNSPHWQGYIEERWLPLVKDRAVVLNWSERSRWEVEHPIESSLFWLLGGRREFNPLAIIVRPFNAPTVIRFWLPFRDFKHGKVHTLRAAEQELGAALGVAFPES
jgi:hypothetical protein